ncbi:MAG: hypothetical protein J5I47_13405 [Vicingus serpentipes]|nr:hypothetical protein [Vicingus serpentipes]
MSLITTKEKLKEFLAISKATEITSVAPYIARAEREYLIPEIGEAMFNDAQSYVDGSSSPTETTAALLKRFQEAIANFAMYLYFDMLTVHVSESGVQRIEQNDRKSAYQYQEDNLRNNLLTSGYETLGSTLNYLEANKGDFDNWAGDDNTYHRYKKLLVHTPQLFSKYFDITNSWCVFFKIRSSIKEVEDLELEPILGTAFLEELKTEIVDDTTDNATLIEMIRKATVFLSIASAAESKIVQFGKNGTFEVRKAGVSIKKEDPAVESKLAAFINKNRATGQQYLKRLKEHLNQNASSTKYATYFDSDLYQDPSSADYSTKTWNNTSGGKSIII